METTTARAMGDYDILKQLGQGAMGPVYLAQHRFMKKQFVLKVLPAELTDDPAFIKRFEQQVGAYSSLDHSHIAKIHNISFAEGTYFVVSDSIVNEEGESMNLARYFTSKENCLEEEELLSLLTQIASALDYAHSKVLVHRGLKLNNIVMKRHTEGMNVYLTDFGLSSVVGEGRLLSKTFQVVAESLALQQQIQALDPASPLYSSASAKREELAALHASFHQQFSFLAPEQKTLEKEITKKADVWAFGMLAYYLITGHYPEGIFPLPSEITGKYHYRWDSLINSCLQSDPDKRASALLPLMNEVTSQSTPIVPPVPEAQKVVDGEETPLRPVIQQAQLERPKTDLDPASVFQIDTAVKYYQPEKKEEKNTTPLLTDMVVIQGGTFFRGSQDGNRDETPRHRVTLSSFAIDIHPVTNEQFVRFLQAMGGEKDSNHRDIIRLKDSRIKRAGGKLSTESGYDKHPVVGVTWYGATAYAKWVGKRLPTEVEWEIAACGGEDHALYPVGGQIEKSQANFFSSDTTAVMSYAASSIGLYDMAGNVYEWCSDWYGYNYYELSVQEPQNPKGPLQGVYRVMRGGCWKSLKEDLRCSRRHRNNPGTVNSTYGFRCAADVQ